jgi:hypothetical protein
MGVIGQIRRILTLGAGQLTEYSRGGPSYSACRDNGIIGHGIP